MFRDILILAFIKSFVLLLKITCIKYKSLTLITMKWITLTNLCDKNNRFICFQIWWKLWTLAIIDCKEINDPHQYN